MIHPAVIHPSAGSSSTRPVTAGRQIRRPRGHHLKLLSSGLGSKEVYDEEEPQYCNCAPDGSKQFMFPLGSRFCAMCGENRPTLKEVQEQFMEDAAAAGEKEEEEDHDDLLRLFVLRREHVIELANKAAGARARGAQPDPLPVCQVIACMHSIRTPGLTTTGPLSNKSACMINRKGSEGSLGPSSSSSSHSLDRVFRLSLTIFLPTRRPHRPTAHAPHLHHRTS